MLPHVRSLDFFIEKKQKQKATFKNAAKNTFKYTDRKTNKIPTSKKNIKKYSQNN